MTARQLVRLTLVWILEGEAADLPVAIEVREHIDTAREEVTKLVRGILAGLDQTGRQPFFLGKASIP
ncbi:hypothetical protein D3C79_811890 [compost metagenome]